MRILFHGIGPEQPTGYGVQGKLFMNALRKEGHEVILSNFNSSFCYTTADGIRSVANGLNSRMGNALIAEHTRRIKPAIVMTMFDTFICDAEQYKGVPWVAWTIVDSAPLHPKLRRICPVPKMLLAMSRFGQKVLEKEGFRSEYVPLVLDPAYSWMDKAEARKIIAGIWRRPVPKYLAVMVAANMSMPSRKNFHGAFRAWEIVHKVEPDSLLYVHTETTGQMANGENLIGMADMCGMDPSFLMFPDQYRYNQSAFGPDYLRTLYAAADVYLCSSLGEGFCVPLIEAQASGCPVIAPAATSTTELIDGETGFQLENLQPIASYGPCEMWLPNIGEMAEAMLTRFSRVATPEARQGLSARTTAQYNVDHVMQTYLKPALAKALVAVGKYRPVIRKMKGSAKKGKA